MHMKTDFFVTLLPNDASLLPNQENFAFKIKINESACP